MTWKIDYKNLLMAFEPDTPAAADKTVSRRALITISFTAVVICESSRRSAGLLADIRVTFVTDSLHKRPLFYMFQVHSKLHFIM